MKNKWSRVFAALTAAAVLTTQAADPRSQKQLSPRQLAAAAVQGYEHYLSDPELPEDERRGIIEFLIAETTPGAHAYTSRAERSQRLVTRLGQDRAAALERYEADLADHALVHRLERAFVTIGSAASAQQREALLALSIAARRQSAAIRPGAIRSIADLQAEYAALDDYERRFSDGAKSVLAEEQYDQVGVALARRALGRRRLLELQVNETPPRAANRFVVPAL